MTETAHIAETLYAATAAESMLEDIIIEAGLEDWEKLGWDHYDGSLEIYGVDADFRFSPDGLNKIMSAGFSIVYVNHKDKWETHYNGKSSEGWRVSYPHKRNDEDKRIFVEKFPASWPKEWQESGEVWVKP